MHVNGSWGYWPYAQVKENGDGYSATVWPDGNITRFGPIYDLNGAKKWAEYVMDYYSQWKAGPQDYDAGTPSTDTSHTITGLTNVVIYTVRVKASYVAGDGPWSVEVDSIPDTAPNTPNAPTLAPSNGKIDISWSNPGSEGSPTTHYNVEWREANGLWNGGSATTSNTSRTITVLPYTTKWFVRVSACNGVDCSAWSEESFAAILRPDAPDPVTLKRASIRLTYPGSPPRTMGVGFTDTP